MIKLNSNKGITLAVLIVVIVVVIILLGISIDMGVDSINDSTDEQFKSELYIVQQAIYQKYIEYEEKGPAIKTKLGTKITEEDILVEEKKKNYEAFLNAYKKINGKEFKISDKIEYYVLRQVDLESLGLSGKRVEESEFIVNYETGEVYNNTKKYYSNGVTPIYLPGYNKDEVTGEVKNNILEIVENDY